MVETSFVSFQSLLPYPPRTDLLPPTQREPGVLKSAYPKPLLKLYACTIVVVFDVHLKVVDLLPRVTVACLSPLCFCCFYCLNVFWPVRGRAFCPAIVTLRLQRTLATYLIFDTPGHLGSHRTEASNWFWSRSGLSNLVDSQGGHL